MTGSTSHLTPFPAQFSWSVNAPGHDGPRSVPAWSDAENMSENDAR